MHFLLLLPVAVSIYRRAYLTPVLLVATLYFMVQFLKESILLYYTLKAISTNNLSKIYLIINTLLIGWFYWMSFRNNQRTNIITIVLTALTFGVTGINYALGGDMSISEVAMKSIIIIFSLMYFNKILSENRIKSIVSHALFWINAGFLFYGTGTFMISLFKGYLLDDKITPQATYNLFLDMESLLSILFSVLVAIGIWKAKCDRTNYIQSI